MVNGQLCHVGYSEKCYGCGACAGAYDECFAFSADDKIRKVSSSGGIFSCIA